MNRIKAWPHLTIVAVVVALIAGFGVAYWMRHEQTSSAEELPYAARIQRVDGEVAISDSLVNTDANPEWVAATPNRPFSVGDRIYTRDNGRTSLAFSGRNFARLDPNTSLDVVSFGDRRTQLALREGSAIFDLGYLAPDELFEVATPYGAVAFDEPGLYNVGFDDDGGVLISVLSGLAQVVGLGGSGEINKGEILTLLGQTAAQIALSRLNDDDAGYLVDDYYRYQYPDIYDGRYSDYDAYLTDPYYYDPYRTHASYQYVSSIIPGINDLDYYGDWHNVDGYGYAWRPQVDSGWVPYQQGYWTNDYPYGLTWVSSEPWGYAPYHYGRWANVGNQWYWIPDGVNTRPAYAPALVAFVPLNDANQIGWVPLGPGDNYAPRYYDDNWRPHYLTRANVLPEQRVNLGIPEAVTVVPIDTFGRVIDRRSVREIDRQRLASVESTLDPLTLTPLRNAVMRSAWGRGKIDLPPGIAKKLSETPVYVGREIREPRFTRDLARTMRVERVSDQARNQKFKRDARDARDNPQRAQQADQRRKQEEQVRKQEIDLLNAEATRGNKEAQRQTRQREQQQRKAARDQGEVNRAQERAGRAQEQARRRAAQQPQGERVGNPAGRQPQREVRQPVRARPENPRPQLQQQEIQRPQPRVSPQVDRRQVQQVKQRERIPPRQPAQRQQPNKPEARQQSQGPPRQAPEAAKQEHKTEAAAQPANQGQGGGGKSKGKGKP
jgi:FecR protein